MAREVFLFGDLSEDRQRELLSKAGRRHDSLVAKFAKERALLETIKRRRPLGQKNDEAYWSCLTGERVNDLKDGWCRVFILNKFGVLSFFGGTRIEEEWLGRLSSDACLLKDMSVWPPGMLPKGNPWKNAHYIKVQVLKPIWHEDKQQFSVTFVDKNEGRHRARPLPARDPRRRIVRPKTLEVTFWFTDEFIKDPGNTGLLVPRKQRQGIPWERGGNVIRVGKERVREVFEPDEYDLKLLMEVAHRKRQPLEVKTHLIRKLRRFNPKAIPMEVKQAVEEWMEAIGFKV